MKRDVVVIGAGHQGLAAATVLAAHGRSVVVVERAERPGGVAARVQVCAEFFAGGLLHDAARAAPGLVDGLGLGRHGLRVRAHGAPTLVPDPAGGARALWIDGDPVRVRASLADRGPRVLERYQAWRAFLDAVAPLVAALAASPPPPLDGAGPGELATLARRGLALRRLDERTMVALLRAVPSSAADWLHEHHDDELVRAALAAPGLIGSFHGPRAPGTAAALLLRHAPVGDEIDGGPTALTDALVAASAAQGAELRTGARVTRIVVEDGHARGVELEGGERIDAAVVASSADPRTTLEGLVAPRALPGRLERAIGTWRARGSTAAVRIALDAPPRFRGDPDGEALRVRLVATLDDQERAADALQHRTLVLDERAPGFATIDVHVPTRERPGLAPLGAHVVSALLQGVPYAPRDGWSDERREALGRATLRALDAAAPGLAASVRAIDVLAPPDVETRHGLAGGHLLHGELGLDQLWWMRPVRLCARYATPIRGLFLCGSGSHPGPTLRGGAGVLAARAILAS